MIIKVLFFGIARDITNLGSEEFKLKEGSSILIFFNHLKKTYPNFDSINDYSFAVNEEYADKNVILKNDDIVALIPPVSGG